MHAVVRSYTGKGARELLAFLETRKSEVESAMRSVPGLSSYLLVRTEAGGFTVTVCRDKAGTEESVRVAKDWIARNAAHISADAPQISEGTVVVGL